MNANYAWGLQQLSPMSFQNETIGCCTPAVSLKPAHAVVLQSSQARALGRRKGLVALLHQLHHAWGPHCEPSLTLFMLGWYARLHPKYSQAQLPVAKLVYGLACERDIENTADEQRKRELKLVHANIIRFLFSASHAPLDLVVLAKICWRDLLGLALFWGPQVKSPKGILQKTAAKFNTSQTSQKGHLTPTSKSVLSSANLVRLVCISSTS